MNWLAEPVMCRLMPIRVDREMEDGDVLNALGGTCVLHTPGHTPGSVCLYQPERRILFSGDALFNANPMTRTPGLRLPPRFISVDAARRRRRSAGWRSWTFMCSVAATASRSWAARANAYAHN
jgi:glyoxylase-like metal-dependent hydrolase (beta-lactamase superfamily II)